MSSKQIGVICWLLAGFILSWGVSAEEASGGDSVTRALEEQLLEAEVAVEQGELRIAESRYREALRETGYLLGLIAAEEGNPEEAERLLKGACNASKVAGVEARSALAWLLLMQGELTAVKELRLLAEQRPDDPNLLQLLVRALIKTDKVEELRSKLPELHDLAPEIAAAVRDLGPDADLPRLETGPIGTLSADERRLLLDRLQATAVQVRSNIGVLQAQSGFDTEAGSVEPAGSGSSEAQPFGRIRLQRDTPIQQIQKLDLDGVELLAGLPPSMAPIVELIDSGDLAAARKSLQDRLQKNSEDADGWTLLGLIGVVEGRATEAEQQLLKAVEVHAKPLLARQALARLYWHSNRREQAEEQLRQAAELGYLARDLSLKLADIEIAADRLPAANRQLRSLDKRYRSAEATVKMARNFSRFGNHKRVLSYLEKSLLLAPSSEEALAFHAREALKAGLTSLASRSAEVLARIRPDVAEYQLLLGRVWTGLGNMGEASEALLKAVELDPDYSPAFLPLGLALNHESRFEEAEVFLTRHLDRDPDNPDALAGLAESEERLGRSESAERRAIRVLEQNPRHARAALVLGMLHIGRKEFAEARELLELAVTEEPFLAKAHYQLSFACARLGDRDCARDHLEHYRKASKGLEAAFVEMEANPAGTLMNKKDSPETQKEGGI